MEQCVDDDVDLTPELAEQLKKILENAGSVAIAFVVMTIKAGNDEKPEIAMKMCAEVDAAINKAREAMKSPIIQPGG